MLLFEWGEYSTEDEAGERLDGAGFQLRTGDGRAVAWSDERLAAEGVAVFGVAGMSYRIDVAQADAFDPGMILALVRERENEFDPNAIAVWDEGRRMQVGYVPAERAAEIGAWLEREPLLAAVLWEWRKDGRRRALRMLVGPAAIVRRLERSAQRHSS